MGPAIAYILVLSAIYLFHYQLFKNIFTFNEKKYQYLIQPIEIIPIFDTSIRDKQTGCKHKNEMKTLENLINEKTYQVIDQVSNRFNFCELVDIDEQLIEDSENGTEYELTEQLPEDVKRAIDTMIENYVKIEDFTGVVRFENDDTTYYLLTW